jgi:hypothetical protein
MYGVNDFGLIKLAAGTGPSLLTFPDGKWVSAMQRSNGVLYLNGSWGLLNRTFTLAPGTSPTLAATPSDLTPGGPAEIDHYTMAWQGSNGHLWIWGPPANPIDTGLAMAPGTSPSLIRLSDALSIDGNYVAAVQGTNGHLWTLTSGTGAVAHDSGAPMAPGTSPSVRITAVIGNSQRYVTAFQGANGDLWVGENALPTGVDTGQQMMSGTSPSLITTPVDLPGAPLGGSAAYVGYTSNTGAVWMYGYNFYDGSTIEQPTGLTAAPGTSPAIVSALNEADGGWVVGDAVPARTAAAASNSAAPASLQAEAAALKLPAKAAIAPMLVPPAASDNCPAVAAHLKQYAARHIKTVACMTVTNAPSAPTRADPKAAASPAATALCGGQINTWVVSRDEECIQSKAITWTMRNTGSGAITGYSYFLFNQDIVLQTTNTLPAETDSIAFTGGTGTGAAAGVVTFTSSCNSLCKLLGGGATTFATAPGQTQAGIYTVYDDSPGSATDTFNISYDMDLQIPGITTIADALWTLPKQLRCDDIFPGNMAAGCVVPAYGPILQLSLGTYGAAAMNVYVGEKFLPGTPGLSPGTPLTRGDPAKTDPNRTAVCNIFQPLATVPGDSCDEYPFASTQQSGGALKLSGKDCLQVRPYQLANGNWSYEFLNKYTNAPPQLCETGHVNGTLNTNVGTALITMYTVNRMLIGDPFAVQITS